MSKFLTPPTVSGTLSITTGNIDLTKENRQTPLLGEHIAEIVKILIGNTKAVPIPVRPVLEWTPQEEELLKVRWTRQGINIPELRYPEYPATKGIFIGRFTSDEIIKKAVNLKLKV